MTIYCKVSSQGTSPTKNIKALSKSIDKVSKNKSFRKKHKSKWQHFFLNALHRYASRANVPSEIVDSFYLDVSGNGLAVKSSKFLQAQQFEYGWDDDVDDNDYSSLTDYSMTLSTMSPRYYIRPALRDLEEEIGKAIEEEVWKEYEKEAHKTAFLTEWQADIPTKYENTNYFQKYSGING